MRVTLPMQHYGQVTQEVLEAGSRSNRRASRSPAFWWTLGIAYLVVFSLVATTAMVILAAQTVQAERLYTAVESSERAMGGVQDRVRARCSSSSTLRISPRLSARNSSMSCGSSPWRVR